MRTSPNAKIKLERRVYELEQELGELKEYNRTLWNEYGSELCAGQMIKEVEALEERISKLKERIKNGKIIEKDTDE